MSDPANRFRSVLATAATVAAIAASLVAVVVVIALIWWVRSLSSDPPAAVAVPNIPAPHQAAVQSHSISAPAPKVAAVQPAVPPPAPAPTALPNAVSEAHGGNDDAAKNRALGAALSRLGDDPDLQRRLREAVNQVPR